MSDVKIYSNKEFKILESYKKQAKSMPSLSELYAQKLLETFPLDLDLNGEYFYPNTFDNDDEVDYLACREIFNNKNWNEVDFNLLYEKYIQFLLLNEKGVIYYLPAFLNYFYNLKHGNLLFFIYFLSYLADGLTVPQVDEHEKIFQAKMKNIHVGNYSAFEQLTPSQSKLVAVFLVNVANLLPENSHAKHEAQRALTNYWGTFLLF